MLPDVPLPPLIVPLPTVPVPELAVPLPPVAPVPLALLAPAALPLAEVSVVLVPEVPPVRDPGVLLELGLGVPAAPDVVPLPDVVDDAPVPLVVLSLRPQPATLNANATATAHNNGFIRYLSELASRVGPAGVFASAEPAQIHGIAVAVAASSFRTARYRLRGPWSAPAPP